ncbi:E4.1 protein [Barthadenovirus mellis]|uniref:E4.1 protein n=1 Tax=Passerine adenovirus 1 TaxID=2779174 RepID=A0A7L9DIT5_9ADEN|nr:E4.1 protein [Passerine adenovirus 1]
MELPEEARLCDSPRTILERLDIAVDKARYEVWALVSTVKDPALFCEAPFKIIFQFVLDSTVYVVVRKDIFPEFSIRDYLRWLNLNSRDFMTYTKIGWDRLTWFLEEADGRLIRCCFTSTADESHDAVWSTFYHFVRLFYPHYRALCSSAIL